jgi:hypothetical protein
MCGCGCRRHYQTLVFVINNKKKKFKKRQKAKKQNKKKTPFLLHPGVATPKVAAEPTITFFFFKFF